MYVENQVHIWKSEDNWQGLVLPLCMWTPSCQAWQHMTLHAHQLTGPLAPCLNTNVNGVYVTQNLPREGTEHLFLSRLTK